MEREGNDDDISSFNSGSLSKSSEEDNPPSSETESSKSTGLKSLTSVSSSNKAPVTATISSKDENANSEDKETLELSLDSAADKAVTAPTQHQSPRASPSKTGQNAKPESGSSGTGSPKRGSSTFPRAKSKSKIMSTSTSSSPPYVSASEPAKFERARSKSKPKSDGQRSVQSKASAKYKKGNNKKKTPLPSYYRDRVFNKKKTPTKPCKTPVHIHNPLGEKEGSKIYTRPKVTDKDRILILALDPIGPSPGHKSISPKEQPKPVDQTSDTNANTINQADSPVPANDIIPVNDQLTSADAKTSAHETKDESNSLSNETSSGSSSTENK